MSWIVGSVGFPTGTCVFEFYDAVGTVFGSGYGMLMWATSSYVYGVDYGWDFGYYNKIVLLDYNENVVDSDFYDFSDGSSEIEITALTIDTIGGLIYVFTRRWTAFGLDEFKLYSLPVAGGSPTELWSMTGTPSDVPWYTQAVFDHTTGTVLARTEVEETQSAIDEFTVTGTVTRTRLKAGGQPGGPGTPLSVWYIGGITNDGTRYFVEFEVNDYDVDGIMGQWSGWWSPGKLYANDVLIDSECGTGAGVPFGNSLYYGRFELASGMADYAQQNGGDTDINGVVSNTGGTLLGSRNYRYYLSTYYDGDDTKETVASLTDVVIITGGVTTGKVTLTFPTLPVGASGFNLYRKVVYTTPNPDTVDSAGLLVTLPDPIPASYVDDGSVTVNGTRRPRLSMVDARLVGAVATGSGSSLNSCLNTFFRDEVNSDFNENTPKYLVSPFEGHFATSGDPWGDTMPIVAGCYDPSTGETYFICDRYARVGTSWTDWDWFTATSDSATFATGWQVWRKRGTS